MNREFKFRVWRHTDKEWGNVACIEVFDSSGVLEYLYQDQENTIQQYIGMKDKNDKEIYEGDIVKTIYDQIGKIEYDRVFTSFRILCGHTSVPITTYRFDELGKPVGLIEVIDKVIGNISENPELLNNQP